MLQVQRKGTLRARMPNEAEKSKKRDECESRDVAFVASSENGREGQKTQKQVVDPSTEQTRKILEVDKKNAWLTDSGASRHISHRREWFAKFKPSEGSTVVLGDDGECEVTGEGTINIEKSMANGSKEALKECCTCRKLRKIFSR